MKNGRFGLPDLSSAQTGEKPSGARGLDPALDLRDTLQALDPAQDHKAFKGGPPHMLLVPSTAQFMKPDRLHLQVISLAEKQMLWSVDPCISNHHVLHDLEHHEKNKSMLLFL